MCLPLLTLLPPVVFLPAAVRAGRTQISRQDMYAGVDRFTQGETRPALPTSHRLPLLAFTAKEVRGVHAVWLLTCRVAAHMP